MFKNLIGGEWVEGPRVSRNINPSDTLPASPIPE
jgi:alpha-ketoglutaric semialdehyde dehydrogenase